MDQVSVETAVCESGGQNYATNSGTSMGTSCSPFIANLVLFMYEFEYFTNQVAKFKPWHVEGTPRHSTLRKLSFCSRYIDDLWNPLVGREEFGSVVQKTYPSWLQLGLECCGTSVNYLDMTIWCNNKTSSLRGVQGAGDV